MLGSGEDSAHYQRDITGGKVESEDRTIRPELPTQIPVKVVAPGFSPASSVIRLEARHQIPVNERAEGVEKQSQSKAIGLNPFIVNWIRLERQEQSQDAHRPWLQWFTAILTRFSRKLLPMARPSILPIRPIRDVGMARQMESSEAIE